MRSDDFDKPLNLFNALFRQGSALIVGVKIRDRRILSLTHFSALVLEVPVANAAQRLAKLPARRLGSWELILRSGNAALGGR